MLRQISESVVISKIREDAWSNEFKKWMELRLHPKDCCKPIASLLLRVIFYALLRSVCYFEYCDDQLERSLDETSFVNRHINVIVCWRWKQIRFFSFVTETLHRKAQQIKDAVIEAKRVAAQLQLMTGQLDRLANQILAEANE